eukprot:768382-Hanusia_phi.AAC.1
MDWMRGECWHLNHTSVKVQQNYASPVMKTSQNDERSTQASNVSLTAFIPTRDFSTSQSCQNPDHMCKMFGSACTRCCEGTRQAIKFSLSLFGAELSFETPATSGAIYGFAHFLSLSIKEPNSFSKNRGTTSSN